MKKVLLSLFIGLIAICSFGQNTNLAVLELLSPVNTNLPSSIVPITVRIANYNAMSANNVPIVFKINGTGQIIQETIGVINGNDTLDYTFATTLDMSQTGKYSYQTYINPLQEPNRSDDTLNTIVCICTLSVNLGSDQSICENATLTINATGNYASYLWSDGSTMPIFTKTGTELGLGVSTIGLQVAGFDGCVAADSVDIEVLLSPFVDLGNDTIIYKSDGNFVLNPAGGFFNYLWQDNSTGAVFVIDTSTIVGNDTTTYFVAVTTNQGCLERDTVTVIVIDDVTSSTIFVSNLEVKTFPNPTNGIFQIDVNQTLSNASIKIYNVFGQKIIEKTGFYKKHQFDLSAFPKGLYLLQIWSENEKIKTEKIMLK